MVRPPRLKETRCRAALVLTMLATGMLSDLAGAVTVDPECHTLRPPHRRLKAGGGPLSLEEKLALSPIVAQARLISRFVPIPIGMNECVTENCMGDFSAEHFSQRFG